MKLECARNEPHAEPCIGYAARELLEDLRATEPDRKVEFCVDADMRARGDPHLVRVMLDNLLGNAWKFTAREDVSHTLLQRQSQDSQGFYIRDNGVGFDMHHADKLQVQPGQPDPFIVVSGSIGEEVAVDVMKSGAHDYVMKDNLTRLLPAIKRELREAQTRRAHRAAEATIGHMAYHDSLTELVNRGELERCLAGAVEAARRIGEVHALLY